MSEYQYVAFRAIDARVTGKSLEFMRKQSSRAKVTSWSFDVEYHFADFHGDVPEMLRRGYDFHLHYADFGVRKLMIRLPRGLPSPKLAEPYFDPNALHLLKDKQGPGAILCLQPYFEPGVLDDRAPRFSTAICARSTSLILRSSLTVIMIRRRQEVCQSPPG